jgi:hypothetical protein
MKTLDALGVIDRNSDRDGIATKAASSKEVDRCGDGLACQR